MKRLAIAFLALLSLSSLVYAEFDRSIGRRVSLPGTERFIDVDNTVYLSTTGEYTVVSPDTLEFTASYYIANRSQERTVTGVTLTDSLVVQADSTIYDVVIVDAPTKASGPATITANAGWTGDIGGLELLSGANSLGPKESTHITYTVRIIGGNWPDSRQGVFNFGPHLGGEVGAGETSGSVALEDFAVPFTACRDTIITAQFATPTGGNGTYTTVRMDWYIVNPNVPGCIGVEPLCINPGLFDLVPDECGLGSPIFSGTCLVDSLETGLGTSTWGWTEGPPSGYETSGDVDGDGLAPTALYRIEWELNPHLQPFATIENLGASEWVHFQYDIDITHNGTTTWTNRLWASCYCKDCSDQCVISSENEITFSEFLTPEISGRMAVGEVTAHGFVTDEYAMPCSLWAKNTGGNKIEKIQIEAPIEDAFPATSTLVDIEDLAVSSLTVDPLYDGTAAHPNIFAGVAGDELESGEEVLATFTVIFNKGNKSNWEYKCEVSCEPDGGGAAEVDTTNCGAYDEGDGEPNEPEDNTPCAWTVTAAGDRVELADITYLGAFTFDKSEIGGNSAGACSYYPIGDGGNGSLIVSSTFNNSGAQLKRFAEVSIPTPVVTNDFDLVPKATTLTGPFDVGTGHNCSDGELYWTGSLWRFWFAEHWNVDQSGHRYLHSLFKMPFAGSSVKGPWSIDWGVRHQSETNWYSFAIDSTWASQWTQGRRLAIGRHSEGREHQGPSLYAFAPPTVADGSLPAANTDIPGSTLLMQWGYRDADGDGTQDELLDDQSLWFDGPNTYRHAPGDFYNGGAFIAGTKRAVMMSIKNKGQGQNWYGHKCGSYAQGNITRWLKQVVEGQQVCDPAFCASSWDDYETNKWFGPREGFLDFPRGCCLSVPNAVCTFDCDNCGTQGFNFDRMNQDLVFIDIADIEGVLQGDDSRIVEPYLRIDWRPYMFMFKDPGYAGYTDIYSGYGGFEVGGSCAWDAAGRRLFVTEYSGNNTGASDRGGAIVHVFEIAGSSP